MLCNITCTTITFNNSTCNIIKGNNITCNINTIYSITMCRRQQVATVINAFLYNVNKQDIA